MTIHLDYGDAVTMWLVAAAVTDLCICLALIFNLRARQKGFNQRTDSILGAVSREIDLAESLILTLASLQLINIALKCAAYTAAIAIASV